MCDNKTTIFVSRGYDYHPVEYKCGNTGPHGERIICDLCADNPEEMERIRAHEALVEEDNAWARSAGWGEF